MRPLLARALTYVCAYEGDQLIGFAKVISDGGVHAFLLDPTVDPDFQRKGIGRLLVTKCVEIARLNNIEWIHVDFEPRFESFYRECGFTLSRAGVLNLEGD